MSRKFLTPLQLPANPTAALEAAPKQYVDARQTIGTTAPVSPNVGDLWYHTDDGVLLVYFDSYWITV